MAYEPILMECTPAQALQPAKDGLLFFRDSLDGFFKAKRWDGTILIVGGGGGGSGWLLDGNANGAEKWIGTQDAFDFPIRTNNIEAGRFLVGGNLKLNFNILDSAGLVTIEPTNRILRNVAGNKSVDWQMRQLYNSLFSTVSVDYGTNILVDFAGVNSVEWNTRHLKSLSGLVSIDWELGLINDITTSTVSIQFKDRELFDSTSLLALEWNTRTLRDGQGLGGLNPVLDWSNTGTQGIGLLNIGSGNVGFLKNTLLTANHTYELPNADGTLTVNGFMQGGNAFGALGVLGTTDANDVSLISNGVEVARLFTTGEFRVASSIQTSAPVTLAGKIRFGTVVAGAVVVDATQYLEVEVDGVLRKVVLST